MNNSNRRVALVIATLMLLATFVGALFDKYALDILIVRYVQWMSTP